MEQPLILFLPDAKNDSRWCRKTIYLGGVPPRCETIPPIKDKYILRNRSSQAQKLLESIIMGPQWA